MSLPVQLDTLVLQNCASSLHYIDRIRLELVNRRYAAAIHATYQTDHISIKLHCPEVCDINEIDDDGDDDICLPDDDYLNTIEYQISGPKKRQFANQRDNRSVFGRDGLRKGFQAIFSRFKHFRKLKLTGYFGKTATESILAALNQPACFPLTLTTLHFQIKEDVLTDTMLIDAFSSIVKKMVYIGSPERRNWTNNVDNFWQSVANCTKLRSLDYRQQTGLSELQLEEMQTNVQKCLKSLQLEHFRYDLPPMESFLIFDSNWIYESFKDNMTLRNLQISNSCLIGHINGKIIRYWQSVPLNVVTFADGALLPIISRLRDLIVTDEPLYMVEEAWNTKPRDITNLLRVRAESGAPLTISYITILDREISSLQLMCAAGRTVSSKHWTEIVDRIKFWLQLSSGASTQVRLLFLLRTENDDGEVKRARLALASCLTHATDETPGAYIEEQRNQIVLRYQLAVVIIDVVSEFFEMRRSVGQKVVYHAM